ncbi:ATP-binding cassette domain-containing protein [Brevibacterium sp. CS2]|uniref:ATP-binding cassette domain-containing protein n=1 Tax=Brevibacterium sp. CS2 TaxID=2575923 RepID=UPI0010C7BD5E|nr:ABC transporter ATP-binding protein [Brevibacterium sp. CS2]QCP05014.1 ABC transporter ATP-binding protein [Brevibacterium sp. CS2]
MNKPLSSQPITAPTSHRQTARTSSRDSAAPVIRVENLTRTYGTFTAVDAISFEVPAGSVFGLLGTNGAGKTSALEVIEGLAPAASGTVEVLGMNPLTDRARLRPMIGIMMQEGGFPHELTVRETARMWHGTLTRPLTVDDALDLVDLGERADRPVKALSGGERRRLDLACGFVRLVAGFLQRSVAVLLPRSRRTGCR